MRRRAFLAEVAAASCAISGAVSCRRRPAPAGPAKGPRIVSVSGSTTEAIFAIGAGEQLVGRSKFCDFPEEARKLPVVGGYVDPNLEAILALAPDLVIGARGPIGTALVRALEERKIATWFPETESIDAILAMIEGLGVRTGREGAAQALAAELRARRSAIAAALADRPRPRTLLLFEKRPISAAGPRSFPDEMLALAGGRNVVEGGPPYASLALERVIALEPELIIDAEMGEAATPFDQTWSSVRAVREGRVAQIRDESVLRPGPRVLDGVAILARAIHPGASIP